jgi:hypothetical protein
MSFFLHVLNWMQRINLSSALAVWCSSESTRIAHTCICYQQLVGAYLNLLSGDDLHSAPQAQAGMPC